MQLRRNVSNLNDVNYNFSMIHGMLRGQLDEENLSKDSISGVHVQAESIDTQHLQAESIDTQHLKAESVKAEKVSIDELSAISANVGEVTAGKITGVLIRTNEEGRRIELHEDEFALKDDNDETRFSISRHESIFEDETRLIFKFENEEQGSVVMQRNDLMVMDSNYGIMLEPDDLLILDSGKATTVTSGEHVSIYAEDYLSLESGGDLEFHSPARFFDQIAVDDLYAIDSPINVHNSVVSSSTIEANELVANNGASGTFESNDGKTVQVDDGIITSIS